MRIALTLMLTATIGACHARNDITSPEDAGEAVPAAESAGRPDPDRDAATGEIQLPCWPIGTRPEGSQFPECDQDTEGTQTFECRIAADQF